MNIARVHAIAAGGVFGLLLIVNSFSSVLQVLRALAILVAKHLTYLFLVRRHRLLGPWSRADALLQVIYFTINMLCMIFRMASIKKAGARAETLAMINMAPLFFEFHLSILANIVGISFNNCRRIHRMIENTPYATSRDGNHVIGSGPDPLRYQPARHVAPGYVSGVAAEAS